MLSTVSVLYLNSRRTEWLDSKHLTFNHNIYIDIIKSECHKYK